MARQILTPRQRQFIQCVAQNPKFNSLFYLTGGTALAAFYLQHRFSEDLDFFSEQEIPPLEIAAFIRSLKKTLCFEKVDLQRSLNRNLIFFAFPKRQELKVELTYFIGSPMDTRKRIAGIQVDSLLDIAVNKAFTIAQNARTRDFIDLYLILRKTKWKFQDLLQKARAKFDVYIDPLQIGSQLIRVTELKDYPRMIRNVKDSDWQAFFLNEAKRLKTKILK